MTTKTELKITSCKCCGEPSETRLVAVVAHDVDPEQNELVNGYEYYKIGCEICGLETELYSEEEKALVEWSKINL